MALAIGLDVGGTKILGLAVDDSGTIVAETRQPSPNAPEALLDSLANAVVMLIDECGIKGGDIAGVGVGVPGLIDFDGVIHETPNLPAVEGARIHDELSGRLGRDLVGWNPTNLVVDNDGMCAAAGEFAFGAAKGLSDAVVITLGTGIGGGIIFGGQVLRGGRGFAGEVGHIVVEAHGPRCVCGRKGCWEQFVSGSGHARLAREAAANGRANAILRMAGGDIDKIESGHVFAAARAGDLEAWGLVDTIARYLALGLANLVEVLDPLAVIIGGGVVKDADVFLPGTLEYFAQTRRGTGERAVEIRVAELGERAGAIGAAAMAFGFAT